MPTTVAAPAQNTSVFAQGVRDNFWNAYMRKAEAEEGALSHAFESITTGGGDSETFAWWESSPPARIWNAGQPASYGGFKSGSLSIVTRDWQNGVEWEENARMDDRTKTLLDVAKTAGTEMAFLRRRIFFQMIQGSTDAMLLPAIGNAPDGGALYAAADGAGADRFGVTGGNLVTSSGVDSTMAIQTDFYSAVTRFPRFLNTQLQPMLPDSVLAEGFIVYFNVAYLKAFQEAFKQDLVAAFPQGSTSNAAVTSVVAKVGEWTIDIRPTPYITDTSWYLFVKSPFVKPLVETDVMQPAETYYDRNTGSDRARDMAVEGYHWKQRRGYAVGIPWSTVKIG